MAEEVNEEQLKNEEQVQSQSVENKPKKSYGWLVFCVINFILILMLAGGGYYVLHEVKNKLLDQSDEISKDDMREIEASKQLNAFQSQLGSMQSQIATFSADVTGKDTHFTKTLADFSQLHAEKLDSTRKELIAEVSQLKRQLGKTRGDWLLADAEYLLSVANQRLHLMSDVKTTRIALEAADQRLRESGDSAAFKVRGQIAKEVESLRSVKQVDVVGIYSSIQILKDKVARLAVILPYAGKPLTESKQIHDHEQAPESEHGVLNSALHLLEGYVTVKHSDQPVTEILTTEEVEFIRQQLGVKVEMIKIALVQQNDALYKASIADTKQWLNTNFTKNTEAKSFRVELDRLYSMQLSAQLPDVSQSLKMLKDITKLRIETDKRQIKKKTKRLPAKQLAPKVKVTPKASVGSTPILVDGAAVPVAP